MRPAYRMFNINPDYSFEENDCVTRAITLATGLSYKMVGKLLDYVAKDCKCDRLQLSCYRKLLEGIFEYPVYFCNHGETVGEISKDFPDDTLLIRIEGHLTCSVNGEIWDIWDCTGKRVDCFWVTHPISESQFDLPDERKSEFMQEVSRVGKSIAWPVVDDLMSMLKATDRNSYNAIMGILRGLP